jgi:hypothetical protein
MSPLADTSTSNGDNTSSRPYWSRSLIADDQESSIFWNSRISGVSADVAAGFTTGAADFWEYDVKPIEKRRQKQAKLRFIGTFNSHLFMITLPIGKYWTS